MNGFANTALSDTLIIEKLEIFLHTLSRKNHDLNSDHAIQCLYFDLSHALCELHVYLLQARQLLCAFSYSQF